jgi:hypothetical protein
MGPVDRVDEQPLGELLDLRGERPVHPVVLDRLLGCEGCGV